MRPEPPKRDHIRIRAQRFQAVQSTKCWTEALASQARARLSGALDERPPLVKVLQAATLNPLKEVVFADKHPGVEAVAANGIGDLVELSLVEAFRRPIELSESCVVAALRLATTNTAMSSLSFRTRETAWLRTRRASSRPEATIIVSS